MSRIALVGRPKAEKLFYFAAEIPSGTSNELKSRFLDACAARDKRSGRVVVYAVTAWLVTWVSVLVWGVSKFTMGL